MNEIQTFGFGNYKINKWDGLSQTDKIRPLFNCSGLGVKLRLAGCEIEGILCVTGADDVQVGIYNRPEEELVILEFINDRNYLDWGVNNKNEVVSK